MQYCMSLYMAAELGFEPRQYESESQVLPLHHSAIARKIFPRSVVCPVFVTRQLGRWVICWRLCAPAAMQACIPGFRRENPFTICGFKIEA